MKDSKKKDKQKSENPMKDYNPAARDFERTEEDLDSVSQSEMEHIEANKRTEEGNTTPNNNRMS